jgi:hypothetical protein
MFLQRERVNANAGFCNWGISQAKALTEAPKRAILCEEKEEGGDGGMR